MILRIKKRMRIKIIITISLLFYLGNNNVMSQYVYGTTGLLRMPTADMQRDKTFIVGASFLEKHSTPPVWPYNTYNYYINITFFPWLEVCYEMTLNKGVPGGYWPQQTWGKFVNQDRQFSVRARIWKESWWKYWTPQIVIGVNDLLTMWSSQHQGEFSSPDESMNGYWNRYFGAITKHLSMDKFGEWGFHVVYVFNKRRDYSLNGPAIGINFRFQLPKTSFFNEAVNGLNLMAEYDSRTVNCGFEYSFWKDYINAVVELNRCKYFSGGLIFKIHLK